MKALCTERCQDWRRKFGPLGLECGELTGDSEGNDYTDLQRLQVRYTDCTDLRILEVGSE